MKNAKGEAGTPVPALDVSRTPLRFYCPAANVLRVEGFLPGELFRTVTSSPGKIELYLEGEDPRPIEISAATAARIVSVLSTAIRFADEYVAAGKFRL